MYKSSQNIFFKTLISLFLCALLALSPAVTFAEPESFTVQEGFTEDSVTEDEAAKDEQIEAALEDSASVTSTDEVIFNVNYEDAPNDGVHAIVTINEEGGVALPTVPERDGHTFLGWFLHTEPGVLGMHITDDTAGQFGTDGNLQGGVAFAQWHIHDFNELARFVTTTHEDKTETLGYAVNSGVKLRRVDNNEIVDLDFSDGNHATVDYGVYKDLNKNGVLDAYESWWLPISERAENLAGQMSVAQIAGLMLVSSHTSDFGGINGIPPAVQIGWLINSNLRGVLIAGSATRENGFARQHAKHTNNLNALAEALPLGIPMNNVSDPRHSPSIGVEYYSNNQGLVSLWPTTLGIAATFDPDIMLNFGKVATAEYRALGITTALSPQIDLATDTRWSRYSGTLSEDPRLSADMTQAYVLGFQGTFDGDYDDPADTTGRWGRGSVNAMIKHWPGGTPTEAGRDAHNEFGAYSAYRGGFFEAHLVPFVNGALVPAADQHDPSIGVATAVMPYYSIQTNIDPDGTNRATAYSKFIIQDMLRDTYGFQGVICTDWGVDGSRGFGADIEPLSSVQRTDLLIRNGITQLGGQNSNANIMSAYNTYTDPGKKADFEALMQANVEPMLTNVFATGSFENPYLDPEESFAVTQDPKNRADGFNAQVKSTVLVKNSNDLLPIAKGTTVYVPRVSATNENPQIANVRDHWSVITDPARAHEADVALVPLNSPNLTSSNFGGGWDVISQYVPHLNQWSQYTAVTADAVTMAGDWRNGPMSNSWRLNRSIRNHTSRAMNHTGLNLLHQTKELMGDKPVVAVFNASNPTVMTEIESVSDAIVMRFSSSDAAVLEVIAGNETPYGLLPFQLPKNMKAVEGQNEDQPRGFSQDELYQDADGNVYDFAYGLTWKDGETVLIVDERTAKYRVPVVRSPQEYGAEFGQLINGQPVKPSGIEKYATVTTLSLPMGKMGEYYEAKIEATPDARVTLDYVISDRMGASGTDSYTPRKVDLVAGLSYDPDTQILSGTPTAVTSSENSEDGFFGHQLVFNVSHPTLEDRTAYRLTLVVTEAGVLTLPDPNDLSVAITLAKHKRAENYTPETWAPFAEARGAANAIFLPMVSRSDLDGNANFGMITIDSRDEIIENLRTLTQEEIDEATGRLMAAMAGMERYTGDPPAQAPNGGSGGGSRSSTSRPSANATAVEHEPEAEPIAVPIEAPGIPFVDVSADDWFVNAVMWTYENDLMFGVSESPMRFGPNMTLTRGMVATVLWRLEDSPESISAGFTDVTAGSWYEKAVGWAAQNEIVYGYGDGLFGPEDNITRQDMAAMLDRYAEFAEITLPVVRDYQTFNDEADIANYAKASVERFFRAMIINGRPGNIFDPVGSATRAEFATMLKGFLEAANVE